MKKLVTLSIGLSILVTSIQAQSTKYWIKFTDKNGTPYTTSNPSAFLTAKSIARRTTFNIPIHVTDLPVTPSYITQVDGVSGVTVLYASKWINGVVVSIANGATSTAIPAINSFSFVTGSAPVNRLKVIAPKLNVAEDVIVGKNSQVESPLGYAGRSQWQLQQLGVDCAHAQGKRGQGITIAVLDAGFANVDINPVFDSLRNRGGILGTRDFVMGGNSVYEDDTHGAACLSLIAAIKPNVILGSAPRADYWLLRTEDNATGESPSEEYNWIRGAEFADSVGADILTTSLGYTTFDKPQYDHSFAHLNGKTAYMSIAATMATRKGMFVLNAAGNGNGSSWPKIGIPADADSICTVGAVDSLYNIASFSSLGPTADGRRKPDLCAMGKNAWVSYQSNGNCNAGDGTSYATPLLAGAIACFWQAHPTFNNMKILDTLRSSAHKHLSPDNTYGWGVPNICAIPIGINERNLDAVQFSVMPNPFSSAVKIILQDQIRDVTVQIINNLGAVIKTITPANNFTEINCDLTGFSSGIYFVKVTTPQGSSIKKVIKQ